MILAGGLTPENVGDAIEVARPFAIDVASGVEAEPGVKDPQKLRALFEQRVGLLTDTELLEVFAHTVREAHWLSGEVLRRGLTERSRAS